MRCSKDWLTTVAGVNNSIVSSGSRLRSTGHSLTSIFIGSAMTTPSARQHWTPKPCSVAVEHASARASRMMEMPDDSASTAMIAATTRSGQPRPVPNTPSAASITATLPSASLRLHATPSAYCHPRRDRRRAETRQSRWRSAPARRSRSSSWGPAGGQRPQSRRH